MEKNKVMLSIISGLMMLVMTACTPSVSGSAEPTVADTKAVKESDTRMIETAKGKVEVTPSPSTSPIK